MASDKSRILVIGGTGYIGKHIVDASVKSGHPTFVLVRENTATDPAKASLIQTYNTLGIQLIRGDIYDQESLLTAVKQVDVVISAIKGQQITDQVKIIEAIKEAGNVKRFIPSEFGCDVDRALSVELAASFFSKKAKMRRAVEAEGIPYTYICCHGFAGYFLSNLGQENATLPPREKVEILGDGNTKGIYVGEKDIGMYTVKAATDPRTLNKVLEIRPYANILSFNEIVSLWEKKIGKTLDKNFVSGDQLLRRIQDSPYPKNFYVALAYSVFVIGTVTDYDKKNNAVVEATELYPEVKYTTVDNYLNQFV